MMLNTFFSMMNLPRRTSSEYRVQARLNYAFDKLDKSKTGYISIDELDEGMNDLGIPVTKDIVQKVFGHLDTDKDGKVSFQQFAAYCNLRLNEIRKTFDLIDTDNNGRISTEEIKLCVQALGMKISKKQLREMVEHAERMHSHIGFEEFLDTLLLLPKKNPEAVFEAWESLPLDDAESGFSIPRDARTALHQSISSAIIQQLYSGGIAGAVSRTATAPIDRIKILAQAAPPGAKSLGMMSTIRAIYAEGGIKGFFRGNGANVLKIAPETASKFMAFDYIKRLIARDPGNATIAERFVAGGAAGAFAQALIYPLEILKTRMAASPPGTYRSLWHCLAQTYRTEGARGLYKGLNASVAGIIPYAGVDLMVNSVFKEWASKWYSAHGQEPGVAILLCGGMISSTTAMICTYPLNLIRTRLQVCIPTRAVFVDFCFNKPIFKLVTLLHDLPIP